MHEEARDLLDRSRHSAGLTHDELWMRYFELGGMRAALEVEAIVCGLLQPSAHDHDVIAHALNERFVELGADLPVPVPYSTDYRALK